MFQRTAKVGRGFEVTIAIDNGGRMLCGWSPDVPTASQFQKIERRYREARDKAASQWAASRGLEMVADDRNPAVLGFRKRSDQN